MATRAEDFRRADVDGKLGDRAGACHLGWHHLWAPDECELDSVVEEELQEMTTVHGEEKEHMRKHAHSGVPSRYDLLRAHAAGDPHPLHGQALRPVTLGATAIAVTPEVTTDVKGGK